METGASIHEISRKLRLGGNEKDYGLAIAVDDSGNAYVTGETGSSDFPTVNALYLTYGRGGSDAFMFKLSADGSQAVYSTYLGGNSNDYGNAIAIDSSGNAYPGFRAFSNSIFFQKLIYNNIRMLYISGIFLPSNFSISPGNSDASVSVSFLYRGCSGISSNANRG